MTGNRAAWPESKADWTTCAEMGLHASALYAAAQGAVYVYAHMIGDEWKPYEGQQPSTGTVEQKSTAAMMAALID